MIPDGWKSVGCSSPSTHPHLDHLWGGCPGDMEDRTIWTVLLLPVAWLIHGPWWTQGAEHQLPGLCSVVTWLLRALPALSLFSVDQGWPETSHFFLLCTSTLVGRKKKSPFFFLKNCLFVEGLLCAKCHALWRNVRLNSCSQEECNVGNRVNILNYK